MLSDVLTQITGILNRRFLLNAFFPSLIFWGLLVAIVIAGQGNISQAAKSWNQQDATFKIIQIIAFISWVTFFSSVLSSQLSSIMRFYEGYWNFPRLEKIGKRWYQARHEKLDKNIDANSEDPCYQEIYLRYPPRKQREQVMPTRLGNILKNAELYSKVHYKIDSVLIWPRLYNLFPNGFVQTLAEAKSALDFMLILSSLSGLFAFVSGVYLLIVGAAWWLFLVCFWGGLLIAWLAYRGALGSAILYAHQVKVAFDLYRNDLLKQMRLPLPKQLKDERDEWEALCKFLYRGIPGNWEYSSNDTSATSGQKQP